MLEKTQLSDQELAEFKALILEKREEADTTRKFYRGQLTHKDDNSSDDTAKSFKPMEQGSQSLSREEMERFASRQEKFIRDLDLALIRIENKTYGICRETGRMISTARLKAVPHATLSIEAKKAR